EENQELRSRVGELEATETELRKRIGELEQEMLQSRNELTRFQSNGSNLITQEEKEELQERIRELIAKINYSL
ncbi:MAG: hypothetical protein WD295_04775, partial [Bacteroidota bacterium]